LLNPLLKEPFRAAFTEGRVIASAVGALWFICAVTAGEANLTTRGTGLSSSAGIFTVTKFLTFKAPQWVWYVYVCIQVLSGIQHEDILGWLAL